MVSSSVRAAKAGQSGSQIGRAYFDARREKVDGFIVSHFSWPGTLRLHRAALGWDILRAPLNAVLSPLLVLTRLAAWVCRRTGWHLAADWLTQRRILLRTSVAGRVEALIAAEFLDLPLSEDAASRDPEALTRAVLAAPQFRELFRNHSNVAEAEALGQRVAGALREYASTRSAVAEISTTLCVLVIGALAFQSLTPGMISMAPGVADAMARTNAINTFPLGQTAGGIWYGMFGAVASPWQVSATIAGLVMTGSVFAAFAGVLADPVQVRLGIHRRRLGRLLDTVETELLARGVKPFVAREHFYARLLDLWDAISSVFRNFRN